MRASPWLYGPSCSLPQRMHDCWEVWHREPMHVNVDRLETICQITQHMAWRVPPSKHGLCRNGGKHSAHSVLGSSIIRGQRRPCTTVTTQQMQQTTRECHLAIGLSVRLWLAAYDILAQPSTPSISRCKFLGKPLGASVLTVSPCTVGGHELLTDKVLGRQGPNVGSEKYAPILQ